MQACRQTAAFQHPEGDNDMLVTFVGFLPVVVFEHWGVSKGRNPLYLPKNDPF